MQVTRAQRRRRERRRRNKSKRQKSKKVKMLKLKLKVEKIILPMSVMNLMVVFVLYFICSSPTDRKKISILLMTHNSK